MTFIKKIFKIKKETTSNILINIFKIIFICFFSLIVFKTIFNDNRVQIFKYNSLFLILFVAIYNLFAILLYKFILKLKIENKKMVIICVFCVVMLLQIIFAYFFMVKPSWDLGFVFDIATNFDLSIFNKHKNLYLCQYPNNLGLATVLSITFGLFRLIGIESYTIIGILLNIITIDFAVYLLYKTVKELFNFHSALYVLIMICLMTPIYTYTPIFYTDTLSMMYPILTIYLFILIYKEKRNIVYDNNKKNQLNKKIVLLSFLLGLVLFVGMQMKFTIIISFIALCIVLFLYSDFKKILKISAIVLSTLLVLLLVKKIYISCTLDKSIVYYNEFPYTHWIMMGLNDHEDNKTIGGYNWEDNEFTDLISGKNERRNSHIKVIKQRLSEFIDNKDLIRYEISKLVYVWGDGTYYAPEKLSRYPVREGIQHQYVLPNGNNTNLYKYYAQAQHISMLIFIILSLLIPNKYLEKNKYTLNYKVNIISAISIFGILLFLVIWEARSRYIVNFIPIFVLSSFYGVEKLYYLVLIKRNRLIE